MFRGVPHGRLLRGGRGRGRRGRQFPLVRIRNGGSLWVTGRFVCIADLRRQNSDPHSDSGQVSCSPSEVLALVWGPFPQGNQAA